MSSEDNISDALTRHQIFVLRYAKGKEDQAERFVAKSLMQAVERLESADLTDFGRSRLQEQTRDLYAYLIQLNKDYADDLMGQMVEFAGYEAEFNSNVLSENIGVNFNVPSPMQLQQAMLSNIMDLEPSKGYTIRSMLDDYGTHNANVVVDKVRESVVLGRTTDQLIGDIKDLIPMQKHKAATIARTTVNHVAVQARKETMKENDDVIIGYEWVATLDSRTSLICASRDGVIYRDFDKDPKPPAHFNCRSTITPKVNPEYDLGASIVGKRPSKGSSGTKSVSGDTNYDQWLRRQSKAFQENVLGKSRAKLFREGMKMDRFVDVNGRPLTLKELEALDGKYNAESKSIESIIAELDKVEVAKKVVQPPDTANVLPDIYSSSKNITASNINSVLERINTPEMAKLKQFIAEKEIKTVFVSQAQMSASGKSANAISGDVKKYLQSSSSPSKHYEAVNGLPDIYWRRFYTTRKPTRTNGFTSYAYDHVVVKGGTKAKFKDPDKIASNIKQAITDLAGFDVNGDFKPWSFSNAVEKISSDLGTGEAASKVLTLIHELGHQVHYFADGREFPTNLYKYRMTEYGTYNSAESHAEAFVAWVINRDAMAKRSPEIAEYFDDLMDVAIKSKQRSKVR